MEVHLPATAATEPDSRDVGFAGQCSAAATWCICGVIHDGCDLSSKENNMRINDLNGGKSAALVESLYKGEYLVPVPYLCLNIDEVGQE